MKKQNEFYKNTASPEQVPPEQVPPEQVPPKKKEQNQMTTFFTTSVEHLKEYIHGTHGSYKMRRFNDGELFLKLETDVRNQPVTVITATNAPAKHMLELFFLLDALQQQTTKIHVILTYFGYERQDHPKPNVARAAEVICNFLKQFTIEKITIVHPHSKKLHSYLNFSGFVPYELYKAVVKEQKIDMILSPDRGAIDACRHLADETDCAMDFIEKERCGFDKIKLSSQALPEQALPKQAKPRIDLEVKNKRILIFDDIISTGSTIIQAAQLMNERGAQEIFALATHGFISNLTLQKITESPINHLWVSNTLPVRISANNLSVINIAPAITTLIVNST